MTDPHQDANFIKNVSFTDYLETLSGIKGKRFKRYREEFRKSINYDSNGFVPARPITVSIELVNRCNLKCIMCYTGHHEQKKYALSLDAVDRILEECNRLGVPALVFGMGAEPLLYKEIEQVLDKARISEAIDIFLGTNGVLLDDAMCDLIVKLQIDRVEVSVDAATTETYLKVRGKNEFERVTTNIRRLIAARERHGTKLPIIRLCFCSLDINKHERRAFIEMWENKVDYIDFQLAVDHTGIELLLDDKQIGGQNQPLDQIYCYYPFNSLSVYADGQIAPCCSFFAKNPEMSLGNASEVSLEEAWGSEKLSLLRNQLLSGDVNKFCYACLTKRDQQF